MQLFMTITQSQISVYDTTVPEFNLWTDQHVAQGFSWRFGHVSFGMPDHDGESLIEAQIAETRPELESDIIRAIEVPFTVFRRGEVATIFDEAILDIPPGPYALQFRVRPGDLEDRDRPYIYKIDLIFIPGESERFAILKRSGEIVADDVLTTNAEPAT